MKRLAVSFWLIAMLIMSVTMLGQKAGGGIAGGVGKVYAAAGKSAAARDLQQKMDSSLLRAAISRSGSAKAKGPALRSTPVQSGRASGMKGHPSDVPSSPAQPVYTDFTPSSDSGFETKFADALGSTQQEREFVQQLVVTTREAFAKEVAAKGRQNNLSAALTFFIATTVTVYHDDPEPSDQAIDKLWDGLNDTLNDLPAVAAMTDAEKQEMYDTLVALSGLVLVGHISAKQSGDANTQATYKALAGVLLQTVMKTDPNKLRFSSTALSIGS